MEDPIKKPFPHNILKDNTKAHNEEFKWWYERVFLQSPSLCKLEYDDEKMWEAWKIAYRQGVIKGMEFNDSL